MIWAYKKTKHLYLGLFDVKILNRDGFLRGFRVLSKEGISQNEEFRAESGEKDVTQIIIEICVNNLRVYVYN